MKNTKRDYKHASRDFKKVGAKPFGGRSSSSKSYGRDDEIKTMHHTTCSTCGEGCDVPFKPNGKKPVFCRNCFQDQDSTGDSRFNKMHKTTCSSCGAGCEVPFKPSGRKPIYCVNCFGKNDSPRSSSRSSESSSGGSSDQLEKLSAKLDIIIKLLSK